MHVLEFAGCQLHDKCRLRVCWTSAGNLSVDDYKIFVIISMALALF